MAHFIQRDVPVEFINGIHGEAFGILSYKPYRYDHPNLGSLNPIAHVGLCLSHYMLWQACLLLPDERFMILEDDAEFGADWKTRADAALSDAPEDFDILLIGNSNASDKPTEHVKGEVYEVKYPFCTHAYILSRKALPVLLDNCRDASTKIDILMMFKAYPHLKVYTVLPRIVNQRNTDLFP